MGVFTHGTNPYFDNYNNQGEQDLLEDLVIESISIFGQDCFYLPRTLVAYDPILGEDASSSYTRAIPLALYIKDVQGFTGDGNFMSKIGVQIQDQVTFTFAKRIWQEEVGSITATERPNEGDLIFFPLNQKLFQIQFVDYKPFFYPLGTLPTFDVTCILYTYSGETIDTGIEAIDKIMEFNTNIVEHAILGEDETPLLDENGYYIVPETYGALDSELPADNVEVQTEQEANNILNFSELDPFAERPY